MALGTWPHPSTIRCSEGHPGYGVNVSFIPFHDWTAFPCVFIPYAVYAFVMHSQRNTFDCFLFLAVMSNDSLNIHVETLCLTFGGAVWLFSKVTVPFYIPTSSEDSPHPCPYLLLSVFSFKLPWWVRHGILLWF